MSEDTRASTDMAVRIMLCHGLVVASCRRRGRFVADTGLTAWDDVPIETRLQPARAYVSLHPL